MKTFFPLLLVAAIQCFAAADDRIEFFETRIRPVLVEHCVGCHGPKKQESELRVDHISFLLKKASYGRPIVPGQPDKSVLLKAIGHRDANLKMPEGGKRLGDLVVRDFRSWIKMGAHWPKEAVPTGTGSVSKFDLAARINRLPWIWKTPTRQALPRVKRDSWPATAIDRFILHRLEEKKLQPASSAKPHVWLRRVHFAIAGLPPTPNAIARFAADSSPLARARVVDQLLASPHFGERWARHWMDLVRYAESRGHESDFLIANAWHYRNYLIKAFNDNVPYDRFVIEHLAGDMLKKPRVDSVTGANQSVLGTGWAFLGEEIHSPVDIRQDECDRVDNKVDVLSKTFLGLTVACARCHDHKFDAIKQSDYYALSGYILSSNFRQVRFQTMEHNRRVAAELDRLTQSTRREMAKTVATVWQSAVKQRWNEVLRKARQDKGHFLHVIVNSIGKPKLTRRLLDKWQLQSKQARDVLKNHKVLADYAETRTQWLQDGYSFGPRAQRPGDLIIGDVQKPIRGVALDAAAVKDPFWDVLALASGNEKDPASLASHSRAGRMLRTEKVRLRTGKLYYLINGESNVYAGVDSHLLVLGPLHRHLTRRMAGNRRWIEHNVAGSNGRRAYVQFGAIAGKPLAIHKVVEGDRPPQLIDPPNEVWLPLIRAGVTSRRLRDAVLKTIGAFETGKVTTRGQAEILNWLATGQKWVDGATKLKLQKLARHYQTHRKQLRRQVRTHSATAVAWMNGNSVDENVLIRGKHQRPGDPTPRRLPTAFGTPPSTTKGSGRLELARQIVDPGNPLTARVFVNRVWHHLFGRGIIETVDNFGYLGTRPTHPELLDHLSWQFVHRDRWSVKRLIRRLVLSSTFAMSSRPSSDVAERIDPKNIWLHRMPVRRLDAEAIRDAVLSISGRLDRKMLGRPVPVHLTEFVVGRGRPGVSGPMDGAGRRSVYISVRRNFLPTLMLTFDTPTPFNTVGRRTVTNVPAQSLALMNDPFIFQQSRVWAERTLRQFPGIPAIKRIDRLYLQAFGRKPSASEVKACSDALATLTAGLDQPDAVALWSHLCHALFSVNDFIYIR